MLTPATWLRKRTAARSEEQQRRQDAERESLLHELAQRVDAAFDFTSREKVELDPRMDVMEGRGVLEFVVRGVRAIFLLSQKSPGGMWMLQVAEDGHPVQSLTELAGGTREDQHSRRLSAARVIAAMGDWAMAKEKPGAKQQCSRSWLPASRSSSNSVRSSRRPIRPAVRLRRCLSSAKSLAIDIDCPS